MINKILVAYDNGDRAQKALKTAIEIVRGATAEIHLLVSVKMPNVVSSVATPAILMKLESESQEYFAGILKEAEEIVRKEGLPVSSAILQERPGEAIIRYAEKEGVDLIVMGSANRGKLERMLTGLGSVSSYVLQNARCPVLVVKD